MKAAIYCRVSTLAQGAEEKVSIPEQIAAIENYCHERNYSIVDQYKSRRPEFQRMLNDAKARKFDVIVCWAANRLSRGMYPAAALMEVIEPLNISLEAVTEKLDTNYFAMLAVVGKIEIDNIKARTSMGRRARAKAGKLLCGRANKCFGYDYDEEKGIRVINERETALVQDIFRWYTEEFLTIHGICRRLVAHVIPTPRGNKLWGSSTIYRMLTNEAYLGHTYAFTQRHIKTDEGIHVEHKQRSEWVSIEGATPKIVNQDTYDKAQARLGRNRELSKRNVQRDYLLRGFVYCSHCGRRFQGAARAYHTRSSSKTYQYYRCTSNYKVTFAPCDNQTWRASELDIIVWKEIENILSNPDVVMAGLKAVQYDDSNLMGQQLDEVNKRLKALDAEQLDLLDQSLRGFPENLIVRENEKLNTIRIELQQRKADIEGQIIVSKQTQATIEGIQRTCQLVKDNLGDLSFENKRMAFEALGVRVWLDGQRVILEGSVASIPSKRNGERMPSISACSSTQL
jgi:site-specific DNA recombinase